MDAATRFLAKVDKHGPFSDRVPGRCWLWTATIVHNGYGRFWFDGRMIYAHRWAYEAVYGPIPAGPIPTPGTTCTSAPMVGAVAVPADVCANVPAVPHVTQPLMLSPVL